MGADDVADPTSSDVRADVTVDTLLRGRVRLLQPTRGFRTSLDPVLLSAFVRPPFGRFVDLGAGCGALSFLLLARDTQATGTAIEIQPVLADLIWRGCAENDFGERLDVIQDDVRGLEATTLVTGPPDLIISNPPFQPVGTGWLPDDPQKQMANHEVTLSLSEWVRAAARFGQEGTRLAAIFPATRKDELFATLAENGFSLARWRLTRPEADRPANRIMVEATWGDTPVNPKAAQPTIEPDLVVHRDGHFTEDVQRMVDLGA